MIPATQSAAKEYTPSTTESKGAASEFIAGVSAWAERELAAQRALRDFVREKVAEPRGFVSRDPLNMSVFGLVFDKAPAAGFLAVPASVANDLRAQGLRGDAYFPDTTHPLGKQVMGLMSALSRVAEQRPLLSTVPGVAPVAVEGNRVVLTRALVNDQGDLVVRAAPSAIKPDAQVTPVRRPLATEHSIQETSRLARPHRM